MRLKINFMTATLALLAFSTTYAQHPAVGTWKGTLEVPGQALAMVIHLAEDNGHWSSTFDSPDQGAFGIPFQETEVEGNTVRCSSPSMGIALHGEVKGDAIEAQWKQGGMSLPFTLNRGTADDAAPNRPQHPTGTPTYLSEEVEVGGISEGVTLRGTLTLPEGKGPFPAVVLVSGSGPQNRDSEVMGHKLFLVLADYLTRQGIAVLRYDDRGVGESTGPFATSTTADFADDAEAVFKNLHRHKSIDSKQTGLLGMSEGGIIAPMVAARNTDVAFVVMLAGPAIAGRDLLLAQTAAVAASEGMPEASIAETQRINAALYDFAASQPDAASAARNINAFVAEFIAAQGWAQGSPEADMVAQAAPALASPWMHYFLTHDPRPDLLNLRCPVLALFGGKDVQVPAAANEAVMKAIFAESGNSKASVKTFAACNHLFQPATTGAVSEYARIEETMSEEVMAAIAYWILALK